MLEKEIRSDLKSRGFELNEMQEKAIIYNGKNLLISAPTGSGKTEGTLLAIPSGNKCNYFLPTVPSTDIMFRRLSSEFTNCMWSIRTSTMTKKENRDMAHNGEIELSCPDAPLMDFLVNYFNGEITKTLHETIVLDEFDHYPNYVKGALQIYLKCFPDTQVIVPSATLSETDEKMFLDLGNFDKISFIDTKRDLVKHRCRRFDGSVYEYRNIIQANHGKRIGIIMNSIKDITEIYDSIFSYFPDDYFEKPPIVYHSQLDIDVKRNIEKKISEYDFEVLVTNDSLSMSVDVDFDVLIMQMSDKLNTNIQRIGRNNRKERVIQSLGLFDDVNLYVTSEGVPLPFIDKITQCRQVALFAGYDHNKTSDITKSMIDDFKSMLPETEIPTEEDIREHWCNLSKVGKEINLRETSLKLIYEFTKMKKGKEIPTKRTFNVKELIYDESAPYSSLKSFKDGNKDMIKHSNQTYRILRNSGDSYYIEPYTNGKSETYWRAYESML